MNSSFFEHSSQSSILSFQFDIFLLDHIIFVAIDNWSILDVHGFACVFQGVQTFLVVEFCWRNAGDHVGIGIASEGVL